MESTYALVYLSHTFNLQVTADEEAREDGFPDVKASVTRAGVEGNAWETQVIPGRKTDFNLQYPDQVNIKGTLTLFRSAHSGRFVVYLKARFGPGYGNRFEGTVLETGSGAGLNDALKLIRP